MHSEREDDCQLCIDILQMMIEEFQEKGQTDLAKIFQLNKKWAQEHYDILQQFGRYPHRNKVLGRENTDEEDIYLRDVTSFGYTTNWEFMTKIFQISVHKPLQIFVNIAIFSAF